MLKKENEMAGKERDGVMFEPKLGHVPSAAADVGR